MLTSEMSLIPNKPGHSETSRPFVRTIMSETKDTVTMRNLKKQLWEVSLEKVHCKKELSF